MQLAGGPRLEVNLKKIHTFKFLKTCFRSKLIMLFSKIPPPCRCMGPHAVADEYQTLLTHFSILGKGGMFDKCTFEMWEYFIYVFTRTKLLL